MDGLLNQPVLRTDISGMPLGWIDFREAVRLYASGLVAYTCGEPIFSVRGGFNAYTGRRSRIEIHSIIASEGHHLGFHRTHPNYSPPLDNHTLFRRDAHICLYCGNRFQHRDLSRDHITPVIQGGQTTWNNLITACKRCNAHKGGRTPEEAQMELLAIPFTPTHAEYVYLKGRRILADQMEFLEAHFPRNSLLHERINMSREERRLVRLS